MSVSAPLKTLLIVIVLTGIATGFAATCLSLLLHFIQHIAFGYSLNQLMSDETFLQGVRAASPLRRLLALSICGLVSGVGFYLLYQYGKKLVPIEQAVKRDSANMPLMATLISAVIQIITVGLGSPLGREVAPREAGAAIGNALANKLYISPTDTKIIIACAAGAGLAAVYNVPFAGALFSLEAILMRFRGREAMIALAISFIATAISWIVLGYEVQYSVSDFQLNGSLILFSLIIGPLLGIAAYCFNWLTSYAKKCAPTDRKIIPCSFINFIFIGLIALYVPEILGNGKGPIQLGLLGSVTLPIIMTILVVKLVVVLTSLSCGARGGLLTPALMMGAMLAIICGYGWQQLFPVVPMYELTIIGAAAFLGSSMRIPLTAIILILELTHINIINTLPIAIAVFGAYLLFRLLSRRL